MFDLSLTKLLVLAVIALVIFGPNELPKMAAQAGRFVREMRRIAEGARSEIRTGLGPEFAEFDLNDLHPRTFMQKHLLSDWNSDVVAPRAAGARSAPPVGAAASASTGSDFGSSLPAAGYDVPVAALAPGEEPPYDPDST